MPMPEQSIEFRYDTQLLLDQYEIRDYLLSNIKGDSMVIAGDSGEDENGEKAIIKLHYHTNEPWDVLSYCRTFGEIYDIVVEDMDRQSRDLKG